MGLPMAKRVVGAGHELAATFHRNRGAADELAALGARVLAAPAEVARKSDTVITILPEDEELKETAFGAHGLISINLF